MDHFVGNAFCCICRHIEIEERRLALLIRRNRVVDGDVYDLVRTSMPRGRDALGCWLLL